MKKLEKLKLGAAPQPVLRFDDKMLKMIRGGYGSGGGDGWTTSGTSKTTGWKYRDKDDGTQDWYL